MPSSYRFGSDTNLQLFCDDLQKRKVNYVVVGDTVCIDEDVEEVADLAEGLGWDVPDPRGSSGVNGFLDISSTSIRSNPPLEIRGAQPLEPRLRQPFSEEGAFEPSQPDRLLGMGRSKPLKTPRRQTRGQP